MRNSTYFGFSECKKKFKEVENHCVYFSLKYIDANNGIFPEFVIAKTAKKKQIDIK